MNMKKKSSMKMRGLMCQSPAATAVCMTTGDPRSLIVPPRQRPDRTASLADHHAIKSSTTAKYSRLVESPRPRFDSTSSANKIKIRSTSTTNMPSVPFKNLHQDHDHPNRRALQKPSSVITSSDDQVFQEVVMRVSLHCQGCAGKVKKHLSKMEGVTSFSIDLENKRVTVMGHVSPVGVLESISQVKKAEFWPVDGVDSNL